MNEREKINETSLPGKEEFTFTQKKVCKEFEIKKLRKYHDLHLKSDALLLANVFENFRKMFLKIHHLDLVKFISAPGLTWQAALKELK